MNIFVSNIPFVLSEGELESEFASYGDVISCRIIKDRETGRSRGFGFVEMENDEEAVVAIEALNGAEVSGRPLNVKKALPRR